MQVRGVNGSATGARSKRVGHTTIRRQGTNSGPGYRFRQTIRWGGRTVSVRQGDGIHLNVTGASIAATMIVRAMRRDGVI